VGLRDDRSSGVAHDVSDTDVAISSAAPAARAVFTPTTPSGVRVAAVSLAMARHRSPSQVLSLLAIVVGCGSTSPLNADGAAGAGGHAGQPAADGAAGVAGGSQDASGTGGTGGSAGSQDAGGCPAAVPKNGDPCTPGNGIDLCEYPGTDALHVCTTRASCGSTSLTGAFMWFVTPPDPGCGTHPSPCPTSFDALAPGSACPGSLGSQSCDYPEGRCGCVSCSEPNSTAQGMMWACRKWDSGGPGCPAVAPLVNQPCSTPELFCYYSGCDGISAGDDLECFDGVWQPRGIGGSCIIRVCAVTNP
jgi:hypothetical protein